MDRYGTGLSKPYYSCKVMWGDPDNGIEINSMVMSGYENKERSYSVRCIRNN
jgi:hypothetical protein